MIKSFINLSNKTPIEFVQITQREMSGINRGFEYHKIRRCLEIIIRRCFETNHSIGLITLVSMYATSTFMVFKISARETL